MIKTMMTTAEMMANATTKTHNQCRALVSRGTVIGYTALALVGMLASACDTEDAEPLNNQEVVEIVLKQGLAGGDVGIIEEYVRADYIQHSALAADGRAGLLAAVEALDGISVEIHRIFGEYEMVATHSTYTFPDGSQMVGFDVFRLQDGLLAEHWDALQLLVAATDTVSGRSMVDGPTAIDKSADTMANKKLVASFVDNVLIGGDFDVIAEHISTDSYAQHNPAVDDGIAGLTAFVGALAQDGIGFGYTQNHLLIAEGNFVLAASEGFFGPTGAAPSAVFYDLFRAEDGKIVEHWDVVVSPAPNPAELSHNNGLF